MLDWLYRLQRSSLKWSSVVDSIDTLTICEVANFSKTRERRSGLESKKFQSFFNPIASDIEEFERV